MFITERRQLTTRPYGLKTAPRESALGGVLGFYDFPGRGIRPSIRVTCWRGAPGAERQGKVSLFPQEGTNYLVMNCPDAIYS